MISDIIAILGILIHAVVLGWLIYKAVKVLSPLFKHPDFLRLMLDLIADAEVQFPAAGSGKKKLEYVLEALLEYCEGEGIDFTEESLTRIINLAVSVVNLIKAFIAGRG